MVESQQNSHSDKRFTQGLPRKAMASVLALSLGLMPFAGLGSGTAFADGGKAVAGMEAAVSVDATAAAGKVEVPEFEGSQWVERYLDGKELTYEQLQEIDFKALKDFDEKLAKEMAELMESLAPIEPAPSPEPAPTPDPTPVPPATDQQPGADDGRNEAPETPKPSTPSNGGVQKPSAGEAGNGKDKPSASKNSSSKPSSGKVQGGASAAPSPEAEAPEDDEPSYPEWSYSGDTSFTFVAYTDDMTAQKFIAAFGEQARQVGQEQGIYASVMLAQAVLESASGTAELAQKPDYNILGMTGSYEGKSVTKFITKTDDNGQQYTTLDTYRSYPGYQECLEDYASSLQTADELRAMTKEQAATWQDAVAALQEACSDDASYGQKITRIIEDYDLARYDEPLAYEAVNPILVPVPKTDEEKAEAREQALAAAAAEGRVLDEAALEAVAAEPKLEERTLADLAAETVSHLGDPYVWGGAQPGSFDCSGLVQYSYGEALQMSLPRTTYYQCLQGQDVDFADLHTGDLLFFADEKGVAVHVAMYLGEGCYIEAPTFNQQVKITTMAEKTPTFAKRMVATQPVPEPEAEADPAAV